MKQKIIYTFFCLMACYFILFHTSCLSKDNTGHFTLKNNSNELITHASIEVCKQLVQTNDIKPHEEIDGTFKINGDSHYKVVILFESGKKLSSELGYVTHGFDFRHTITVTDSSISINDTTVK